MLPINLNNQTMILILLGLIIILLVWIVLLEVRLKKLMMGKNGKSLEDSIVAMKAGLNDYMQFKNESIEYLKNIEARLKRSLQSVETVRFNPFKGTGEGGNQSFATAFVNEKGDGVVFSSLYARDHVSVFSKPVKKYQSDFELSNEEKRALEEAKKGLINK